MRARADAGAAIGEASHLPVGDELLQVFGRVARMHGENVRTEGHDRDRAQIVDREALVFGGGLVDGKGGGGGEDGVTVGRRATHRFRGEIAAGATAVFHHHRLAETLAQLEIPEEAGVDHLALALELVERVLLIFPLGGELVALGGEVGVQRGEVGDGAVVGRVGAVEQSR